MTREEINEIRSKSLMAMKRGPWYAYTPSPMRLVELCDLALRTIDKPISVASAQGTEPSKPFEAGGTGF